MRIQTILFSAIAILNFLASCESKQQGAKSLSRANVSGETGAEAEIFCIRDVYISASPPTVEAPDALVIVIYSSNALLNQVTDSAQLSKLVFWQESFESADDSDAIQSHHVRKIKLGENQYKLYFATMRYRFDSSGEVATTHKDFKPNAKIRVFSKQNDVWEISTCP